MPVLQQSRRTDAPIRSDLDIDSPAGEGTRLEAVIPTDTRG